MGGDVCCISKGKRPSTSCLSKEMGVVSKRFDWSGIEFPGTLKQIDKFEKQNEFAVYVYGYDNSVYPLRISKKQVQESKVIRLLLISNDEANNFCWIKNLSRLVSSQVSIHNDARFFCDSCLNSFQLKNSLEKHQEYCLNQESIKMEMPVDKDGNPIYLNFKNYNRKICVPFVIYADFESFTEPMDTCSPKDSKSFTLKY